MLAPNLEYVPTTRKKEKEENDEERKLRSEIWMKVLKSEKAWYCL